MNIKDLKSIIKESVREAVREELVELFKSTPNRIVTPQKPSQKQSLASMLDESSDDVESVPVKKEFKKYTNSEMLNKILNETTALAPEGSMVSGLSEIKSSATGNVVVTKADAMLETVEDAQAAAVLKKAFTKNYSKLLKAVDSKVKGGSTHGLVTIDDSIDDKTEL